MHAGKLVAAPKGYGKGSKYKAIEPAPGRYVKAKASSELQESSVESRILEVEQATANVEAQSRLSQLRTELGLESGSAPAPQAVTEPLHADAGPLGEREGPGRGGIDAHRDKADQPEVGGRLTRSMKRFENARVSSLRSQ